MNNPTQDDLHGYASGYGADMPERPWILTPWDVWMANPHYQGPPIEHPEAAANMEMAAEAAEPLGKAYCVTMQTTVPVGRVGDLLCCALEGGSTYWCDGFKPERYPKVVQWGHEAVAHGVPFIITTDDEPDGPPLAIANSPERIAGALQLMADQYPKHWAEFINENEDAITGDVFFQLLCFGEVIYG